MRSHFKKYWKVESPFKKCSALLDLLEKNWNRILWVQKEVIIFSYLLCLAPTWFRKYLVLPIRRCQSRITNIGFKCAAVRRKERGKQIITQQLTVKGYILIYSQVLITHVIKLEILCLYVFTKYITWEAIMETS